MNRRITIFAAAILWAGGATTSALAADASCFGADSTWTFGGVENDPAAFGALATAHGCKTFGYCTFTTAEGMAYALSYDNSASNWTLGMKQRAVASGETLPFGITPADAPATALKKIQKAGQRAGYGRTMEAYPASVGLGCPGPGGGYLLEFNYDAGHRMTTIRETPTGRGYIYVDDVTKSFMMQGE